MGYQWQLRQLMAERQMFQTSDLVPLLAERGITLSWEQVYRLVTQPPQRMSMDTLVALCDILQCTPKPKHECVHCGRLRPANANTGAGPACSSCYMSPPRLCDLCQQTRPINIRRTEDQPAVCGDRYRGPKRTCVWSRSGWCRRGVGGRDGGRGGRVGVTAGGGRPRA